MPSGKQIILKDYQIEPFNQATTIAKINELLNYFNQDSPKPEDRIHLFKLNTADPKDSNNRLKYVVADGDDPLGYDQWYRELHVGDHLLITKAADGKLNNYILDEDDYEDWCDDNEQQFQIESMITPLIAPLHDTVFSFTLDAGGFNDKLARLETPIDVDLKFIIADDHQLFETVNEQLSNKDLSQFTFQTSTDLKTFITDTINDYLRTTNVGDELAVLLRLTKLFGLKQVASEKGI